MGRSVGLLLGLQLVVGGCGARRVAELETRGSEISAALADCEASLWASSDALEVCREEGTSLRERVDQQERDLARLRVALDDALEQRARVLVDRGALRGEIDDMKQALELARARKRQAEDRVMAYRSLVERFQDLTGAGTLSVRVVDGRVQIALPDEVLFPSGSAQLTESGRATLLDVAAILQTVPERHFQVEGHTDDRPIRTATHPSNWHLAADRAIQVVQLLAEAGVPESRLSAAAYADNRPVASNDTPEGRGKNRRLAIVVIPDLSGLPGHDELMDPEG